MAQPRWMRRVQVGSVLAMPSGTLRIVRAAKQKANGDLWGVTFAIRHCSWTGRCYTVYTASDLRVLGYRLVRVRPRRLTKRIDKLVARAIADPAWVRPYPLTCCDVEGIA